SPMRHDPPHEHAAADTPPTATTHGCPCRTTFTAALVHSPIAFSRAASSDSSRDSQITPDCPVRSVLSGTAPTPDLTSTFTRGGSWTSPNSTIIETTSQLRAMIE